MGDVTEMRGGSRLSVSQIAAEFAMSRNTVAKRIEQLGVKPDGRRLGYPVYRLRDIIPVVAHQAEAPAGPGFDPLLLHPTDRRAWFQSENERLKAESDSGRLIPAGEVEAEIGLIVKTVTRALDTLPDQLERDRRISPADVEYVMAKVDALKRELQDQVGEAEDENALRVGV